MDTPSVWSGFKSIHIFGSKYTASMSEDSQRVPTIFPEQFAGGGGSGGGSGGGGGGIGGRRKDARQLTCICRYVLLEMADPPQHS